MLWTHRPGWGHLFLQLTPKMAALESCGAGVTPLHPPTVSPLLNSAVFIWHLYGSVIGTLPTFQWTQNTQAVCSQTLAHARTHSQLSAILNLCLPDWKHFVRSFEWRHVFSLCVCMCEFLYIQSGGCLCINNCSESESVKRDFVLLEIWLIRAQNWWMLLLFNYISSFLGFLFPFIARHLMAFPKAVSQSQNICLNSVTVKKRLNHLNKFINSWVSVIPQYNKNNNKISGGAVEMWKIIP